MKNISLPHPPHARNNCVVLGTAKLYSEPSNSQVSSRGPEIEEVIPSTGGGEYI